MARKALELGPAVPGGRRGGGADDSALKEVVASLAVELTNSATAQKEANEMMGQQAAAALVTEARLMELTGAQESVMSAVATRFDEVSTGLGVKIEALAQAQQTVRGGNGDFGMIST